MLLGQVFERFVKESPVSVMVRGLLEKALCPQILDELFERSAKNQYTRELLFSTVVNLMSLVVCGVHPSVHAAHQASVEKIGVSVTSVYNKINGIEPSTSGELVREVAASMEATIRHLNATMPDLLPGYRVKIIDGNAISATEHRLKALREISSAPLPGQSLVVLDPSLMLAVDVFPCEDGPLNNIGIVYSNLGQYQKALEYYNQALAISNQIGDVPGEANILNNIGAIYRNLDQYQKALKFYSQALAISNQIGDVAREANTLNNIGVIYESLGQFDKALSFYEQSLLLNKKIANRASEAIIVNNMGRVYYSLNKFNMALELYQQSLAQSRELKNSSLEGSILNNIGNVYSELGNPKKALEYYQQSLIIGQQIGDYALEATVLGNFALIYSSLGDNTQVANSQQKCLSLAQKIRFQSQQICFRKSAGSR